MNLGSLNWEHGVLATGPPGKSPREAFLIRWQLRWDLRINQDKSQYEVPIMGKGLEMGGGQCEPSMEHRQQRCPGEVETLPWARCCIRKTLCNLEHQKVENSLS